MIPLNSSNINEFMKFRKGSFPIQKRCGNETKPYYLNYNNIFVYGLAALKELDNSVSNNITNIIDGYGLMPFKKH